MTYDQMRMRAMKQNEVNGRYFVSEKLDLASEHVGLDCGKVLVGVLEIY